TTFQQELEDEIKDKVAIGMSVIFGSTFVILLFAFRSILIPIVALKLSIFIIIALIGMSIDRNANNNITKVDPNITDIPMLRII
ncbi:hypothetical protein ACT453_11685, partial [Bacillus sp. D-CC]